ncbi:GNAT family N-acetyltransferase [Enterococcus sp.]|uniref:GNAT family N-acetyltransferase n=1 Tax=Enterococcus sp. TaxID=35783 RepID=UPI0025B95899|nr:GNAT family N-acetyltransferase [Enterococcus sp.]
MEIIQCTPVDLATLRAISIETYQDTFAPFNTEANMRAYLDAAYQPEKLAKELNNPQSAFFFLNEEAVAGYLKLNWGTAQTETIAPEGLEIERIYIRSEYKRRGYGQQLLTYAEEVARSKQKTSLWLGVWEHNENALAFYHKMGFQRVGSHSFFMGDDEQTDYLMEKPL